MRMDHPYTPTHYLLVDFEATCCDQGSVPRQEMEIIEVGAVMVDSASLGMVGEFQSFVRPQRHPRLTAFCSRLTHITQAEVDAAPTFPEVCARWKTWLGGFPDYLFCSWGDYDRTQLEQDCALHRVPYPMRSGHLNVKRQFARQQHLPRPLGLGQAVALAGLTFIGTHHRGIDDARNIAQLLPFIFGEARVPR
ncbi:3'-5' exonuclease [Leeia aquatica]|nr:3'-5' exonuclease [Leeia aquatica]